jgi:putative transposase
MGHPRETWGTRTPKIPQTPEVLMFIRHRQCSCGFLTLSSMPQGLHRSYGSDDLHFLTFSCYHRKPFFRDAALCDLFLKALEGARRRYRFVVLGYVVMPEHVHLLVSEPQRETLSTVVQALKLSFIRSLEVSRGSSIPRSRKSGETWGTPVLSDTESKTAGVPHFSPSLREVGIHKRFWQARFYDFNVWTEKKRIEKLRYIHRNPVRRGLVSSPEQWQWSSFRWYLSGAPSPVRINDTDIMVMKVRARAV